MRMKTRLLRNIMIATIVAGSLLCNAALLDINVVDDYGATPAGSADDAPAFQAAFDALAAAGGGRLFIPAGNYMFNSQVTVTGDNATGARLLTIQGEPGVQLYVNNSNGLFKMTYTTRSQQVNIHDLTMIAYRDNAGTAIEITSPFGGAQDKRVVTIENVTIRTQVGNTSQFFNKGIVVNGVYRPLIKNCSITRTTSGDMGNSSPNFVPSVGIDVSDCYAPVIQDCTVKGAYTAFNFVSSTGSASEDGAVMNCVADYCRIGVKFHQIEGVEPTFWVTGCRITARDVGVWVKNRRVCHVTDNIFIQLSASHALNDVQFDYVHLGFALRNLFSGTLAGGRKNIVVDADGSYIIIKDNVLSGTSSSAIQIDAGADNILFQ